MIIGLTGGIASGKSTVSNQLSELGATIIDADQVAHDLMEPYKKLWQEVVDYFGEEILLSNDKINREKLGELIFNDPTEKKMLDQISHPVIINEIKSQMNNLKEKKNIIVVDIPLLIETNLIDLFKEVWLVYVNRKVQIKRLMARDNIDRETAIKKIESQMPLIEKRKYADRIIENNGTKEELKEKVVKLWRTIN